MNKYLKIYSLNCMMNLGNPLYGSKRFHTIYFWPESDWSTWMLASELVLMLNVNDLMLVIIGCLSWIMDASQFVQLVSNEDHTEFSLLFSSSALKLVVRQMAHLKPSVACPLYFAYDYCILWCLWWWIREQWFRHIWSELLTLGSYH